MMNSLKKLSIFNSVPGSATTFSRPCLILSGLLAAACIDSDKLSPHNQRSTEPRPNILLIVADDLGYTDLGIFGSEIATPNLDELASAGVLFTNFHTSPTCSPTRAMLLSGTDHHLAGLGSMSEWMDFFAPQLKKRQGYEGYLNFRVASLANLMRDAGYRTYMTGKWHLGLEENTSPAARGFERSFALLHGGGGHLGDLGLAATMPKSTFRKDGKLSELPENFYSTRFYTEEMIKYLREGAADKRPFFAYLSYTAPHWPLQAPRESISRYQGNYDQGYEVLFKERLQRMKERGLVDRHVTGPSPPPGYPGWAELTPDEKRREARIMEIYAAMIGDLDLYVGRLLDALKELDEYENTVIFFMSDNGAEGATLDARPMIKDWVTQCCDNRFENMGNKDSYLMLGPAWARASVGASRLSKGFTTEGGILSPAFVSYPGMIGPGRRYNGFLSVMDVLPTFLELANTAHPGLRYQDRQVLPVKGKSFAQVLHNPQFVTHRNGHVMGWELFGRAALREGDWKIVRTPPPQGDSHWALYNVAEDPAELRDLSGKYPEKFKKLLALWDDYVRENGVVSLSDIEKPPN